MAQRCDLMHFKCLIVNWINSYSHIFEFNGWDLGFSNMVTNQVLNQLTTFSCCHKICQHIFMYFVHVKFTSTSKLGNGFFFPYIFLKCSKWIVVFKIFQNQIHWVGHNIYDFQLFLRFIFLNWIMFYTNSNLLLYFQIFIFNFFEYETINNILYNTTFECIW